MRPWVIYDGNLVEAYEGLQKMCESVGRPIQWCDELWAFMLEERVLLYDFMYYLDHHVLSDHVKAAGYSLTDLYVQQLDRYNIRQDTGKNTAACNKEEMVLDTFYAMAKLRQDPEGMTRKWQEGFGMDNMT